MHDPTAHPDSPSPTGPSMARALAAAADHREGFTSARASRARLAIVACMDRRLDVMALFSLSSGDAYIIRNAGGILTDDVRRSLAIAQHVLGVEDIILLHHTDCGMHGMDDDLLRSSLAESTGIRPDWTPGGFACPETDLRRMLDALARDPHIPSGAAARGFIYDVATGGLTEVVR